MVKEASQLHYTCKLGPNKHLYWVRDANHWLKTLVPIKTYADNACCDGYWHIIMLMLSIFVKERFSRILEYVYSNVHERST